MISKNMLAFWKPWCTSNIFTFEFECTLKTLIYFSMIPPLLLLGMITTMSGSSTLANWRELWTLLCLQNCCKKCTFNAYSNSYSPFLFVPVSETAVSICQAQPTYWGKKIKCLRTREVAFVFVAFCYIRLFVERQADLSVLSWGKGFMSWTAAHETISGAAVVLNCISVAC